MSSNQSNSTITKLTPLEERLGASWAANPDIQKFFASETVKKIAAHVSQERRIKKVYPSQENVFRAFRETPLSTVKVVWMGQDPYNTPGQATGLAMDCGKHISPTIEKILYVYNKEYPESFNTDLMEGKLLQWAHQGVFLFNAALTVVDNQPKSHLETWEPFAKKIIEVLIYDQNPKVFIGLGKESQNLLGTIPGSHTLLKYEHPVYASYQKREWDAIGIFHKINEILKFYGRPEINW